VLVELRRGLHVLLGPMFFYDMLCHARRGRYVAIRCFYAVSLLAAIFGLYASWFGTGSLGHPLPQDVVSRFATSFFITFLAVQLAAVLLLTPVLTASAIAEEKERRRLDFLLVTELRDHEIVVGKLASRLATVGLTLLTGLPILSLMQFLGGVDPNLVLAGFAVTLFTMVSVASIGMWMSSICDTPSSAIWLTYILVLGYLGLCWCPPGINLGHPAVLYYEIERGIGSDQLISGLYLEPVAMYGVVHLLVSGLGISIAMYYLRPDAGHTFDATAQPFLMPPAPPPSTAQSASVQMVIADKPVVITPAPPERAASEFWSRPPIDDENPLLWKELHIGQEKTHEALKVLIGVVGLFLMFVVVMVCLALILEAVNHHEPIGHVTNPMARWLGSALGCFILLAVVFNAVGTVSREREQHTLDNLLTLPIDRGDILWAKWLGSILSVRRLGCGLLTLWMLALLTGGLHILALPLLLLVFGAHLAFAASLGLWFSVVSPSKVQATLRGILTLFVIMLASLLLGEDVTATTPMSGFYVSAVSPESSVLFPVQETARMRVYGDSFDRESMQIVYALAAAILYALVSMFLWQSACKHFRRE
jgi:ABC-type transport system involved in multi-copper enzyme maturation permease subunit